MAFNVVAATPGTWVELLDPPVGKKYELLTLSCSEYAGSADHIYIGQEFGGVFTAYLDEFNLAAGGLAIMRSYQSVLITHNTRLMVNYAYSGAATSLLAIFTYMDVDV